MNRLSYRLAWLVAASAAPMIATQAHAAGGVYVGGSVGYGWTEGKAETATATAVGGYFASTSITAINAAGIQKVTPNGFNAGLDAGYDWHSGPVLMGVMADFSLLDGSDSASTTQTYPCCAPTAFTVTQELKTKWMATVRARVGYDFGGATVYLSGGYAGLQSRYSTRFTDTFASALETSSESKYRSGWVVGGGADIKIGSSQWSVQPEYMHADFGHYSAASSGLVVGTPPSPRPNPFTHRVGVSTDIVRIGVHYHF